MCQAFEGEQRFMIATEERATTLGYEAAKAGKPRDPRASGYMSVLGEDAWYHGYDCVAAGIVPHHLDTRRKGEP